MDSKIKSTGGIVTKSKSAKKPTGRPVTTVARKAMNAELLDSETEVALARAWRDHSDEAALHRLVTAYMRLAIPIASKYCRYGASMNDLIQEANVGLMKAANKFDPDRGVRFSTYAVWWVKASIQDYVMRNWSLVRTGSTSSQKSLFFNMRRVRAKLERDAASAGITVTSQELRMKIAEELGCRLRDVEMMEGRLAGPDFSLYTSQSGEDGREWVETLEDEGPTPEERVSGDGDIVTARKWLIDALGALTDREKIIIAARKLADEPETLESLGTKLGLSKERVRQLEAQALRKMKKRLESRHGTAPNDFVMA